MDDPIKVIHEFKNRNNKIQYNLLIYVGNIMDKKIMEILRKIQNLDFYETLTQLTKEEYEDLESIYGEFWYLKFFITYHIDHSRRLINETKNRLDTLTKKYGPQWIKIHIKHTHHQNTVTSFETKFYNDKIRVIRRRELFDQIVADQEIIDTGNLPSQLGGQSSELIRPVSKCELMDIDTPENSDDEEELNSLIEQDTPIVKLSDKQWKTLMGGEDDNLDEYEDIVVPEINGEDNFFDDEDKDNDAAEDNPFIIDYNDMDNDVKRTTDEIKEVMKAKTYQFYQKMIEIEPAKDNDPFDQEIRNVYQKNYVENQYIFKDDTIHTIRNKICIALKNAPRFGEDCFIIPQYQYLWTEYRHNNELKRVMLGFKFIVKNNLMDIEIKPNPNLRHYQELRGNLRSIYDTMNRPGRYKKEDDDANILYDYSDYMSNNEIYMVDIMNQLGLDFHVDTRELGHMIRVYFEIYFPRIRPDELRSVFDFLTISKPETVKSFERNNMRNLHKSINNLGLIQYDIMRDVELMKVKKPYVKFFHENHITQTNIHANINFDGHFDLYYLFDNFKVGTNYPFIQYQPLEQESVFKTDKVAISNPEMIDTYIKWFENSPYGISLRLRLQSRRGQPIYEEKYMAINITDTGRIDYKIPWKEEHQASIEDIIESYQVIYQLIDKINSENDTFKLIKPEAKDFRFAFINSIQRFTLPGNYTINHDDLSDFSRYFFPYVALMIDPRKRKSKSKEAREEFGKSGTYLRFKRISGYEVDSRAESRILQIMKNYEYDDNSLANVISRDFNITTAQAMTEIEHVRQKHPNIKKARVILKKLDTLTKTKIPGISISIQGKTPDKYGIRTEGARDQEQLDRIITFTNILIYYYYETYLLKKPERQVMLDRLKTLTDIAQRKNKVERYIRQPEENITIKQIIRLDADRLSTGDAENWARECQENGNDKRRRPQPILSEDDLVSAGYAYNPESDFYERKVMVDDDGNVTSKKKKSEVTLRAIKLPKSDGGVIYYTCSPEDNGKHMFVGFLARNVGRPCCFIKDQYTSSNKTKRDNYLINIGKNNEVKAEEVGPGDILYILQDTNKIPEGRYGFLPKYLDIFFNYMLDNDKIYENNHLVESKSGYYFKYGIAKENDRFLHSISVVMDTSIEEIKNKLKDILHGSKGQQIFTALNNGAIKEKFKTPEKFWEAIDSIGESVAEDEAQPSNELLMHFLSIPGIIHPKGLSIIMFEKTVETLKLILEKEKVRENYFIVCQNEEEADYLYIPDRPITIIIKDGINYYPIMKLKKNKDEKDLDIQKIFYYNEGISNIIVHIEKFFNLNCQPNNKFLLLAERETLIAKRLVEILEQFPKEFQAKSQYVDTKNKCRYIICHNGLIIPTSPSGSIYYLSIIHSFNSILKTIDEMLDLIDAFNEQSKTLKINVYGVNYVENESTEVMKKVTGLILDNNTNIPLKPALISRKTIEKYDLYLQPRSIDDMIDQLLINVPNKVDERAVIVKESDYHTELYQLFRLELSNYFATNGSEEIQEIITSKMNNHDKRLKIKRILYQICSSKLSRIFNSLVKKMSGGKGDRSDLIYIYPDNKKIDYLKYERQNQRRVAETLNQDECESNFMTHYTNECHLGMKQDVLIDLINKVVEEMLQNDVKADEIFQRKGYGVSRVVDRTVFTEREGQTILRATNKQADRIFSDLFGEGNKPIVGRRRRIDTAINAAALEEMHPLREIKHWFVQPIIDNNNTVYRAIANSLHWRINAQSGLPIHQHGGKKTTRIEEKINTQNIYLINFGYYNQTQTQLANVYKAKVIDWLLIEKNANNIKKMLNEYEHQTVDQFIHRVSTEITAASEFLVELHILSIVLNETINIFNENYRLIYYFNKGMKPKEEAKGVRSAINLQYLYLSKNVYPDSINVIYPK